MKTLLMAGAAVLATAGLSTTAMAQDMDMDAEVTLTTQQQTMYDGWPMDRRNTYDGWPGAVQTYYWTLPSDRQEAYWMLNDEQRVQVYQMTPAQRTTAWGQIMSQMNAAMPNANASANAATTPSRTGTMPAMSGNGMVQQIPAAHQGEYPPCRGDRQDNCINPREAGLNYGNRPLAYWPGRPASEMDD